MRRKSSALGMVASVALGMGFGGPVACDSAADSRTVADGTTSDTPTPVTCQPGQVVDCNVTCVPASLLGDGSCDSAFNCEALAFDQGDCLASHDAPGGSDGAGGPDDGTAEDAPVPPDGETLQDVPVTPLKEYAAVIIEDAWDGRCRSPNTKGEGFDLDAVGLFDSAHQLVGYADSVLNRGVVGGTGCGYDNGKPNPAEALGPPNGDKDNGFVALNRGAIGAEFAPNSPFFQPGDVIEVFESQCSVCSDEPFTLLLASAKECVVATAGCDIHELGTGLGSTSVTLPASAF